MRACGWREIWGFDLQVGRTQEGIATKEDAMARRPWSMQEAKNRFSAVVEAARRAPQTVTKHGIPVVVMVDADHYERLCQIERAQAPNFKDHLLAIPQDDGAFERLDTELRETKF
jgi:prevent-host-death family protein